MPTTPSRTSPAFADLAAREGAFARCNRELKPGETAIVLNPDRPEAYLAKRGTTGTYFDRLDGDLVRLIKAGAGVVTQPATAPVPARPAPRPAPAPIRRSAAATAAPDAAGALAELRRTVGQLIDALAASPPPVSDEQRSVLTRLAAQAGFSVSFAPAGANEPEPGPGDAVAKRGPTPGYGSGMFADIILGTGRQR